MTEKLQHKQLGTSELTYKCPLCGMPQEVWIKGLDFNHEEGYAIQTKDNKYAFCNCKNIFFTDWSNIVQEDYNEDYSDRYNLDHMRKYYVVQTATYFPLFKEVNKDAKKFLEIGMANDFVLECAKKFGYEPFGVDVNPPRDRYRHNVIMGNIEHGKTRAKLIEYDIIWASHVFEHFKDPISIIKLCYKKLNNNGVLFIAMPDPYFIVWQAPQLWWHWVYREHHIMWDMDSFIDVVVKNGFKLIKSVRNDGIDFHTRGDYHLVFQKC